MKLITLASALLLSMQLFALNINTATQTELCTLKGIGQVTAQKIVEYRQDNKFNAIEELKNVNGIGDIKFEKIKDDLSV